MKGFVVLMALAAMAQVAVADQPLVASLDARRVVVENGVEKTGRRAIAHQGSEISEDFDSHGSLRPQCVGSTMLQSRKRSTMHQSRKTCG